MRRSAVSSVAAAETAAGNSQLLKLSARKSGSCGSGVRFAKSPESFVAAAVAVVACH